MYTDTYKCLLESFIDSVLLYGAEVWGCMRGIDAWCRAIAATSLAFILWSMSVLWSEMDIMPIVWMARVRCIVFWFKVSMTEAFQGRVVRQVAHEAIGHQGTWIRNLHSTMHNFIGLMWLEMTGMGCHVQK